MSPFNGAPGYRQVPRELNMDPNDDERDDRDYDAWLRYNRERRDDD